MADDIKKLALKHCMSFNTGGFADKFVMTEDQLESLLAEHLLLSSSEPVVIEAIAEVVFDADKGKRLNWLIEGSIDALEIGDLLLATTENITGDNGIGELFKANPINQQLLDSHKRLEEMLMDISDNVVYFSGEPEYHEKIAKVLASIPEQVRNINESKDENK